MNSIKMDVPPCKQRSVGSIKIGLIWCLLYNPSKKNYYSIQDSRAKVTDSRNLHFRFYFKLDCDDFAQRDFYSLKNSDEIQEIKKDA